MTREGLCKFTTESGKFCPAFDEYDGYCEYHYAYVTGVTPGTTVDLGLPYAPKTRQEQGRISEKKQAKKVGARVHPMSGAGRIKDDASDEDVIYEFKDATKTHTVNAAALKALLDRANAQGKDAVYMITFANGVTMEGFLF